MQSDRKDFCDLCAMAWDTPQTHEPAEVLVGTQLREVTRCLPCNGFARWSVFYRGVDTTGHRLGRQQHLQDTHESDKSAGERRERAHRVPGENCGGNGGGVAAAFSFTTLEKFGAASWLLSGSNSAAASDMSGLANGSLTS